MPLLTRKDQKWNSRTLNEAKDRLHTGAETGQDRPMKMFKIAAGLLVATAIIVFSLARITFELIGWSTAPDDFTLLKQRMPRVLEWLFTTPWIVPTLIVIGATALATWLLWSGIRGAALEPSGDAASLVTMAEVEEAIGRHLGQQEPPEDSARSTELEDISASIAELRERIGGVGNLAGEAAKNVGDVLGLRIQQLNERMDGIASSCAELEATVKGFPRKIDALMERNRERIDSALDGINQAFRAILNREWHQRLFRELGEDFDALAEPVRQGTGIPDNAKWKQSVESWWGKLDQWLVIADYYAANAATNIKAKKKDVYEGDWPFDESALNSNQINRYKETAICWLNARDEKARIDRCLENSAFTLPANKWRLDPPPTID